MQSNGHAKSGTETDDVTARLREMIMNGTFAPNERLTEMGLAEQMNVSRTPIRLALARLEREEIVIGVPNRGFRVRAFTIDDFIEILEVRATLEGMAARLAAERGVYPAYKDILDDCLDGADQILESGSIDDDGRRKYIELNVKFHSAITDMAGNSLLARRLEGHPFRSAPLLHLLSADKIFDVVYAGQMDHKRVAEAIAQGEGTRAEFAMREHALSPKSNIEYFYEYVQRNAARAQRLHAV